MEEVNEPKENPNAICPITGDVCMEDKCAFWSQLSVMKMVLGAQVPQQVGMCVFKALLLVTGSPKPEMQRQTMNLPPNMMRG